MTDDFIKIELKPKDFPHRIAMKSDVGAATLKGVTRGTIFVHQNLPGPPTPRREPFPWASKKQRMYVLSAVKDGRIVVPYKRSNEMLRRMTHDVNVLGSSYVGVIGTNEVYAPWVISNKKVGTRGPQARYHQGIWWILQEEVGKRFDDFIKIVRSEIAKHLSS